MIKLTSPTKIALYGYEDRYEKLKKFLTFTDTSMQYQIKNFKKAYWFVNKFGEEAFKEKIKEMEAAQQVCLLEDKGDHFETYSGLYWDLIKEFDEKDFTAFLKYPDFSPLPWQVEPKHKLRDYQQQALEKLLEASHGNVALPTGSGKSYVIMHLLKRIGLKAVVMAPSVSIARQLYEEFKHHIGTKYVGLYGDGKKEFKKKIVIAISKSLVNVEEGTEVWTHLSEAQVFIADESHLTPADTLKKVCFGVLGTAPYRFFVSATQMRNDGAEMLLKAIIGRQVYVKEAAELIKAGYLAKPNFFITQAESKSTFVSNDVLKMLHYHFYNNRDIHASAATLANKLVTDCGHQVLIMVDHIEQFQYIHGHLRHKFAFAHGGVNKDNRGLIPEIYWKSDPNSLVAQFNDNKLPILISTGCLSIGTDFKTVDSIFNLQAGKSEIKFRQLVGRGTRINDKKTEFNFFDVDLINIPSLHRHSLERVKIYRDIYDCVKYI